jgi:DNA polymerase-3 subunit alpha
MDCFNANRRQMLQGLPVLVTNIEEQRRQTMYGQVGFFDISDDFGNKFELPKVDEFSNSELLQMEKEMTGLYLSGHPMDKYEGFVSTANCVRTYELIDAQKNLASEYKDGSNVTLCGIITHITIKQTRSNSANMAFVTLEDLYGTIEVILFPKTFTQYAALIRESNVIAVSGTLSIDDDKDAKILVNTVIKPNQRQNATSMPKPNNSGDKTSNEKKKRRGLFLKFDSKDDTRIAKAKIIVSIFDEDGNLPLYFYYSDTKEYHKIEKYHSVLVNNTMICELKKLLGDKNVAVID